MIKKKKGVFLIYVLFTAILITVFLLTAVKNMHNSYFITNKFTGENKAYWAAEAGLQYCEYKLKNDLTWPFLDKNGLGNNTPGTEQFGKFKVTSSFENNNKGYYIHGISETDEEEFFIYFSKKESNTDIDLVPSSFPSESKNLSYCSYNSINEENLLNFTKSNKIEYSDVEYTVSKSPLYKAIIITPGIYIISDGRCRNYRTAIEKMFIADYGNTYGGGVYAGGEINIGLINQNNRFKVNQVSNSRPKVYCKKNVTINRNSDWTNMPFFETITNNKLEFPFPCNIADGTLYLNNKFDIHQQIHNSKYHTITTISNNGNKNKENNSFKQKYGIHIEDYKDSDDSLFPQVSWNDVEAIKKHEEDSLTTDGKKALKNIPSGSYVAIFNDDEGQRKYELIHIPYDLLNENGELDKKGLEVLENIKTRFETNIRNKIRKVKENRDNYYKARNGNVYLTDEAKEEINEYEAEYEAILKKMETRTGLIEIFASEVGGSVIQPSSETNELSKIFSINTVDIVNITDIKKKDPKAMIRDDESTNVEEIDDKKLKISYEIKKTPVITLKKSASTDGNFNLLTLKINNTDNGFTCEAITNTSTDLVMSEKITGFNESYVLANNNISNKDKGVYDNLIAGDSVNLYSNGNVIINGKLSGKGQIFSKKSLSFKAGTALNNNEYREEDKEKSTWKTKYYTEKENVGEISKIAAYSRASITMSPPEGEKEENLNELHNKIKNLLTGKDSTGEKTIKENGISGTTIKEILNNILYTNVSVNEKDLTRVASKIVISHVDPKNYAETEVSLTSEITMNDFKEDIPLLTLMRKYYGFEDREARDYIEEIIQENCNYDDKNNLFKMPTNSDDIVIMSSRSSSSFSGLIYACGGFKCDAKENNIVINGTIVSYGADPSSYSPGSGGGLKEDDLTNIGPGNIEIKNCKDFTVVYDSTDLATFVHKNSSKLPVHLSNIYSNKL